MSTPSPQRPNMIAWRLGSSAKPTAIPGHPIYLALPDQPETIELAGSAWQVARKIKSARFYVNDARVPVDRFEFADGSPDQEVPKESEVVWLTFL